MDLNDYWQENKRFLTAVLAGVVLFFLGWMMIDRLFGAELVRKKSELARIEAELREPMFGPDDLEAARRDNRALREAAAALARAAEFAPRERFELAEGAPASNRYFAAVTDAREGLLARAGRAGISIPSDLGLPALSPTREPEVRRTLEALDVIERALGLAIETGVARVEEIRIRLDSRVLANKPIDDLEKTRVEMILAGSSQAMARFLLLLESPSGAGPILVDSAELKSSTTRAGEVRLEIALLAVHLHGLARPEEPRE